MQVIRYLPPAVKIAIAPVIAIIPLCLVRGCMESLGRVDRARRVVRPTRRHPALSPGGMTDGSQGVNPRGGTLADKITNSALARHGFRSMRSLHPTATRRSPPRS